MCIRHRQYKGVPFPWTLYKTCPYFCFMTETFDLIPLLSIDQFRCTPKIFPNWYMLCHWNIKSEWLTKLTVNFFLISERLSSQQCSKEFCIINKKHPHLFIKNQSQKYSYSNYGYIPFTGISSSTVTVGPWATMRIWETFLKLHKLEQSMIMPVNKSVQRIKAIFEIISISILRKNESSLLTNVLCKFCLSLLQWFCY